jgi:hypothetical protein
MAAVDDEGVAAPAFTSVGDYDAAVAAAAAMYRVDPAARGVAKASGR